ncbi:unnamed protein product [Calicophoron daubneyi]|uniref:Uncharacterized protein n=1 Tax=Calicophoron daubneyi TaxID=300641 RepID=A0AAV2TDG4_CALDB
MPSPTKVHPDQVQKNHLYLTVFLLRTALIYLPSVFHSVFTHRSVLFVPDSFSPRTVAGCEKIQSKFFSMPPCVKSGHSSVGLEFHPHTHTHALSLFCSLCFCRPQSQTHT